MVATMFSKGLKSRAIIGLARIFYGRTREDKFQGHAEYETIRQIKQALQIPIIANCDISTPKKAEFVLEYTLADGLIIG